ncbi:MAG: autotransporter outer membrane beta-barrel domain-containing protein [Rhodobacteraceae bacterium]|nr:autotransporter outer membrane beta-barrel domain-containing protein [Paracoccaceae bacterium]MCY4138356.1 autotransporter outer membrane beta-barrel domain-containing protein [Paracoccaceae bacterium]
MNDLVNNKRCESRPGDTLWHYHIGAARPTAGTDLTAADRERQSRPIAADSAGQRDRVPSSQGFPSRFGVATAVLLVSAILTFAPGNRALAQTPVCDNEPEEGERVECDNTDANPIDIKLDGVDLASTDDDESAVYLRKGFGGSGDIDLSIVGSSIKNTASSEEHLIYVRHDGSGDISVGVRDSSITNLGEQYGIRIWTVTPTATGAVDIQLDGARMSTDGDDNIQVQQNRSGDVRIRARNSVFSGTGDNGRAMLADASRDGAIEISVSGGSIQTEGDRAGGIVAFKSGSGATASADAIKVTVDGVTIKTTGGYRDLSFNPQLSRTVYGSHGIAAEHRGSGTVDVSVRGGSIDVSGAGSHGIALGGISGNGQTLYATSARDDDGYRRQTVTVDGPVRGGSGNGAGVYLAGGGRVIVGPNGSVGATSGTAIRAASRTGQAAVDDPKLHVDLRTGGRRIADLLSGNIVNEGGASYTTVVVNGKVLMDGGTVADDVRVPNGLRDVALRAGASGASLLVGDFVEPFAPRAAVYEALPGFMLRLDEAVGASNAGRLRTPDSPLWLRVAGGLGSYRPGNATVGARYRFARYGAEAGTDFRLRDDLTGWAGVRLVSGSAKVSAATGGGRISAAGYGLIGGLDWQGGDRFYAAGRVSLSRYTADLSSVRGNLKKGAAAQAYALDLEGGRHYDLDEKTTLTARAWLRSSRLSSGRFQDADGLWLSIGGSRQFRAGAGVATETRLTENGGADRQGDGMALHGSLGVERTLDGKTAISVSGEQLESKAKRARLSLGGGGVWRWGDTALRGTLAANGFSGDTAYTAHIDLTYRF